MSNEANELFDLMTEEEKRTLRARKEEKDRVAREADKCKQDDDYVRVFSSQWGKVTITRSSRTVQIESIHEVKRGFGGIPIFYKLNLADFIETKSGIPWNSISDSIRGYKIILLSVEIEKDNFADEWCRSWFQDLGCKF